MAVMMRQSDLDFSPYLKNDTVFYAAPVPAWANCSTCTTTTCIGRRPQATGTGPATTQGI
ncbi:MAG: hypothetical protein R2857_10715 [Vampirovibrionales bacterium]